MRYYQAEHEDAYRKIVDLDYTQWNDLFDQHNEWTYDHFQNRAFLERVIPDLFGTSPANPEVLEYGCGTGPAACFLAARGFQVNAFDLIPEAITIAKRMASDRDLDVTFDVADICALPSGTNAKQYDLVLDSFCLQSIVTDQDRNALYSAVQSRLRPTGYYLISTAFLARESEYGTGFRFDEATGICFAEVTADHAADDVIEIDGRRYKPHRRHLSADALQDELIAAGFSVLDMEISDAANVVCRLNPI